MPQGGRRDCSNIGVIVGRSDFNDIHSHKLQLAQSPNDGERLGMGAEDFGFFTTDPYIPSLYFAVGGTPPEAFEAAANGGAPIPSHHSPIFKIEPEGSVTLGVEASVSALLDVMAAR